MAGSTATFKDGTSGKNVYTTGEVAQICRVSQQTVIRCFDSGRLKGFRVPGSRFRRIPRDALVQFMKENGIPLDNLESGKKRVLIVDDDQAIVDMLVELLERDGRFEVKTASTGYDAGLATHEFRPDLVILDFKLPDINGNVVCRTLRGNPGRIPMLAFIGWKLSEGVWMWFMSEPSMVSGGSGGNAAPSSSQKIESAATSPLATHSTYPSTPQIWPA